MNEWEKMEQERFDRLNKQYDDDSNELSINELCDLLGATQHRSLREGSLPYGARETEIQETINRRKKESTK